MFDISPRTMDPLENTWSVSRSPLPIEPSAASDSDSSMNLNFTATLQNRRTRLEGTPHRTAKSNFVPQVESCVVKRTSPGTPWGIQIKGRGAGMSRWIEVSDVVDGSLSHSSGVHIGDSVVSIDSISLAGCRFEEVRELFYSGKTIVVERPLAEFFDFNSSIGHDRSTASTHASNASLREQNVTGCDLTATFGAAETQKREDAIARGEREVVIVRRFTSVQLGMVVGSSGDHAIVTRVKPDGPADLAGVVAGDRILRIDGMPMNSAAAATDSLRLAGTTVVLNLLQLPEAARPPPQASMLTQSMQVTRNTKVQTLLSRLNDPIVLSVAANTDADSGDEETNELAAMYQRMLSASEDQRHAHHDTLHGAGTAEGGHAAGATGSNLPTMKPAPGVHGDQRQPASPVLKSTQTHHDETPLSGERDKDRPDGPDHADAVGNNNATHNTTLNRIGRSLFQLDKLESTRDRSWKKFLGIKDLHRLLPQKIAQRQGEREEHATFPRRSRQTTSTSPNSAGTQRENSVPDGSIGRDRSGVDTTNTGDHDTNSDNASAAEYLGNSLTPDLSDIDDAFALEGEAGDDLLNTLRVAQDNKTASQYMSLQDRSSDGFVETVELTKSSADSGFGLGIRANPWHPYARVSSIIAGGVAENSGGKVCMGDRVLAVDGVDGFGNADAVPRALRNADTKVQVCITLERDSSPLFDAVHTRACRRILRDDQCSTTHPTRIPAPAPDIFRLVRDLRRTLDVDGSERTYTGGKHFNASVQLEYATMRRAAVQMSRIQRQQLQRTEELTYTERMLDKRKRILDAREMELQAQQTIVDNALRDGWDELKLQRLAYHRQLARFGSPTQAVEASVRARQTRPHMQRDHAQRAHGDEEHIDGNDAAAWVDTSVSSEDMLTACDDATNGVSGNPLADESIDETGIADAEPAYTLETSIVTHRGHSTASGASTAGDNSVGDEGGDGTRINHDDDASRLDTVDSTCAGDTIDDATGHGVADAETAPGTVRSDVVAAVNTTMLAAEDSDDGEETHVQGSCDTATDAFSNDTHMPRCDSDSDGEPIGYLEHDLELEGDYLDHEQEAGDEHLDLRQNSASDDEQSETDYLDVDHEEYIDDLDRSEDDDDDDDDASFDTNQNTWAADRDEVGTFSDGDHELSAENLDVQLQELAEYFVADREDDVGVAPTDPDVDHGLFTEI